MKASTQMKWAYCLVLLHFALQNLGRARALPDFSWLPLSIPGMTFAVLPFLSFIFFFILAVYRIYTIVRVPNTLYSNAVKGMTAVLRNLGIYGIYAGALIAVISILTGPLMRVFMTSRTESGAEFFFVGVILSMFSGIGTFGLLCFEFSRLITFERDVTTS